MRPWVCLREQKNARKKCWLSVGATWAERNCCCDWLELSLLHLSSEAHCRQPCWESRRVEMRWDLRHGREVVSRGQRKGGIPVEGELEDCFFA